MLSLSAARQRTPQAPPIRVGGRAEVIGFGGNFCGDVSVGDVAPEIYQGRGDREMSGVQHLDDFSHDLVAAQPCAVRKPCVDEIREHVTAVLTAGDPLLDNANNGCICRGARGRTMIKGAVGSPPGAL